MAEVSCPCGARYRVPDGSIGKKAKCKRCGETFVLQTPHDSGPIPLADDSGLLGEIAAASTRSQTVAAQHAEAQARAADALAVPPTERSVRSEAVLPEGRATGALPYFRDLLGTLVFPRKLVNLISFAIMWAILAISVVTDQLGLLGAMCSFIIAGWYAAYRFAILDSAAAGEDDLAVLALEGGFLDGVIFPFFKWVGTWGAAFLPVIVFVVLSGSAPWITLLSGVSGILTADGTTLALVALVAFGLFVWPMIALCVSLGGFESLMRVDLILVTIVKTFPMYLLTVGIVFGTAMVDYTWQDTEAAGGAGNIAGLGVTLYLDIIAMRAIGLYYRHFKDRFAWDWG